MTPKVRWVKKPRRLEAMVGPFFAVSVVNHNEKWHVWGPGEVTKIATAASEDKAKALAERWITDEWSKLVVETLAEDETNE